MPAGPALDPGDVYEQAIAAGLVVHRPHPLNAETAIPALLGGAVTPTPRFYVRNHFQIPELDANTWRLEVGGLVERPLSLTLRDLQQLPSQTMVVTLECAGNGRARFDPPAEGEKWNLGAAGTAAWTGVPLVEVLDRVAPRAAASEIVFRGADSGTVLDRHGVRYERSLTVADARGSEALLAYAMNGEPLPREHGFPLRLIVPRWYGMTAVKWLTEIDLVDEPFAGHFQTNAYFYEWSDDGEVAREPVTLQNVRSLITEPSDGDEIDRGEVVIRGVAWSGAAPIGRVEVSIAGGPWSEARLAEERVGTSWSRWELATRLEHAGTTTIRARATDLAGRTQPDEPRWNRLGYGNNAIQQVVLRVR
jgi:DMSO/TMAO reductase YedYZ molybdopterin-dependent catalytic subunit